VGRPGFEPPTAGELRGRFGDLAERITGVETVPLAHSASAVRALAAAGRSIRYLVPPAVETYICEHRLYRSPNPPEDCPK
jgi:nicotinate-nucleotide adenylyltransferase